MKFKSEIITAIFSILAVSMLLSFSNNSLIKVTSTYDFDLHRNTDSFFKSIYNLQFQKSDSLLIIIKRSKTDANIIASLKANQCWWKLLCNIDKVANTALCNQLLDEIISDSELRTKKSSEQELILINAHSLKTRLKSLDGKKLASAYELYNTMNQIEHYLKPGIKDENSKFVAGMYYYFSHYINNELSISKIFTRSKNDIEKNLGLKYLEECSESRDLLISTESNYFLLKIYTTLDENYKEAMAKGEFLHHKYPGNFIYGIELLKIYKKLNFNTGFKELKNKLFLQLNLTKNNSPEQFNHFKKILSDL